MPSASSHANEGTKGPALVNEAAAAGGTRTAFVLDPAVNLNDKLLSALNEIRGAALPCAFTIPKPQGTPLNFGQVNVHFTSNTSNENIPYVGSADKCDPVRGGWYYDVNPDVAEPKQVIACEKTCARFKAEPAGKVQIGFGCKTIVIR